MAPRKKTTTKKSQEAKVVEQHVPGFSGVRIYQDRSTIEVRRYENGEVKETYKCLSRDAAEKMKKSMLGI